MSKFPIFWNLSNNSYSVNSTSYPSIDGTRGLIPYDPTDFDGLIAVYFEITILTTTIYAPDGYSAGEARLVDVTNNAAITGSTITDTNGNSNVWSVYRSGNILSNMPASTANLSFQNRIQHVNNVNCSIRGARLIFINKNGTKWKILLDCGHDYNVTLGYTKSNKLKLYTSGNFDGTTAISFGCTHKTSDAAQSIKAALRDDTANSNVTNSEVTTTSTTETYSESSALTLTTGNNHVATHAPVNALAATSTMRNAHIIIRQSATPTKTEVHLQLHHFPVSRSNTTDNPEASYHTWHTDYFSNITKTLYHEGCFTATTGNTSTMQIDDDGTNIGIITSTSTSNTRVKSSSFSEPGDASLLIPEDYVTAGAFK